MIAKSLRHLSDKKIEIIVNILEKISKEIVTSEEDVLKTLASVIQDYGKFVSEAKHILQDKFDHRMIVYMYVIFGSEEVKEFEKWWKHFSKISKEPYKEIIKWAEEFSNFSAVEKWSQYFKDPEIAFDWYLNWDDPKDALEWSKYFDNPTIAYKWAKYFSRNPESAGKWAKYFDDLQKAIAWSQFFPDDPELAYKLSKKYKYPSEAKKAISKEEVIK
jgi:hypothetical protein